METPTTSLAELNDHFGEFQANEVISRETLLQKGSYIKVREAGYTDEEINAALEETLIYGKYRIHEAGMSVIAPNGTEIDNLPERVTKSELVKKIYKHENNLVWEKRKDLLIEYSWAFVAPFVLMLFLLTLRYLIEGFFPKND